VDELRSILAGTFGLAVAAALAIGLAVARARIHAGGEELRAAARLALAATGVQALHFAEELATGFPRRFPELLGLEPWSLRFFVSFNLFWLAVWALSSRALAARHALALRELALRRDRGRDPARAAAPDHAGESNAMSEVTIRRAQPRDAAVLTTLVAGFRDHLRASSPADADLARSLPAALADPAIEFCCAWQGDEAVGYTQTRFLTSVWVDGLEAHLEDLFVIASARRRAVGRALLRHALARAQQRGARRFSLNTNDGNLGAHALYGAEGLAPQSHALYPGGREVLWVKALPATDAGRADDGPAARAAALAAEPRAADRARGARRRNVAAARERLITP
jgi:ribosomal protein S18 acetylase RimI-like enzyme